MGYCTYVMYHCRVLLTDFFRNTKYKKSKGMKAVLHFSLFSSFQTVCNRFTNCETRVIGNPTFLAFLASHKACAVRENALTFHVLRIDLLVM